MGLNLIRKHEGTSVQDCAVGSYGTVHYLRATLLVMLVDRLWQIETLHPDRVQGLLDRLDGANAEALGLDEDACLSDEDLDERSLQIILDKSDNLRLDYAAFTDSPHGVATDLLDSVGRGEIPVGGRIFTALVGASKFLNHSDCDGVFSRGDVLDIATFLEFVLEQEPRLRLGAGVVDRLDALKQCFRAAAEHGDTIVFA